MEIANGIHRVETSLGRKLLAQHMLVGERIILLDAGCTTTPTDVILPYVTGELGRPLADVALCVVTHADADHLGGLADLRRRCPGVSVLVHARDARWLDPDVIMVERYDQFRKAHGISYPPAVIAALRGWMGPAVPADVELQGGERLRYGPDGVARVLHAPGHTPGHMAFYEPRSRCAVITDAALGLTQIDLDGLHTAPPPYNDRDGYLATVTSLLALDVDILLTSHYPVMRGDQVTAFLTDSRDFVFRADAAIASILQAAPGPLTLRSIVERADPLLGPFVDSIDLAYAALAHLEHAVRAGSARRHVNQEGLVAWTAA